MKTMPQSSTAPRRSKPFVRIFLCQAACLCLVVLPAARGEIESVLTSYRDSENGRVLVACHRAGYLSADGKHLPENSVPAIRNSINAGAEILEIDLAMTSDGHLVLLHDKTLDRTTTGKGPVSALTLAQVKELHLRDPDGGITQERVPTFRETMELVKGKAMVNLDKLNVTDTPKMDLAMKVLRETGTVNHAIFKGSTSPEKVRKALARFPEKPDFMPVIANTSAEKVISILDELKPEAVEIVFKDSGTPMLSPEVLAAAKRHGTRIWINSLWASLNGGHDDASAIAGDPSGSWGWIVGRGADIIQTDYGQPLLDFLKTEGKRDTIR